jgi:hypothetical protein
MPADPRIHIPRSKGPRLAIYSVNVPMAPLQGRASRRAGLETQLLYGQHFDVYALKKGWAWGQARSPVKASRQKGYVGFVSAKCLADEKRAVSHVVTALKAPIFSKADIKSPVMMILPMGAIIKGSGRDKLFLRGAGGFIHRRHIRKLSETPLITDFAEIAERHLGLPYIWGGISSDGLDCSGLVLSSLRATGKDAPRDTDMQQTALGKNIAIRQSGLKRGDLVFWKGHVGIMQNGSRLIHANAFDMKVASEPLKQAAFRIKAGGGGTITAIKRL